MIQIDTPDTTIHRFGMEEVVRATRHGKAKGKKLESWIGLGEVMPVLITLEDVQEDPELALFVRNSSKDRYAYYYVKFLCSFGPMADEVLDRAVLNVSLRRIDGARDRIPIAWSMQPTEQYTSKEVTRKAEIGAKLYFLSPQIDTTVKEELKTACIRAYRVGESTPYWEFSGTDQFKLDGTQRLHMIVRAPSGAVTEGTVELSAFVQRRRFVIITKDQAVDQRPIHRFVLPA